jgi:hypothetical protein
MEDNKCQNYQLLNVKDVDTNGFPGLKTQNGVPNAVAPIGIEKEGRKHKSCHYCGQPYKSRKATSKFCSRNCAYKGRPKALPRCRILTICKHCGHNFLSRFSELKRYKGVYCSRKCYFDSRKDSILVNCVICHKQFKRKSLKNKYCSRKCFNKAVKLKLIKYKPKLLRRINKGYILVSLNGSELFFSQMADKAGYVYEHRLIMAKHLGRCLLSYEVVHHKNGIKGDNRLTNLELYSRSSHMTSHNKGYQDGYRQGWIDGRNNKIISLTKENITMKNILQNNGVKYG